MHSKRPAVDGARSQLPKFPRPEFFCYFSEISESLYFSECLKSPLLPAEIKKSGRGREPGDLIRLIEVPQGQMVPPLEVQAA